MVTALYKSLKPLYSWGNSISNRKIQNDIVILPVKNNQIDFASMESIIHIVEKLVIKDVVLWADENIAATREVINKN